MRVYSAATMAALESGEIAERGMVRVVLPSGIYGFWTGAENWDYEGATYSAAGELLSFSDHVQSLDGISQPFEIRLSTVPGTELDEGVLARIEQENYKFARITVSNAYFSPVTDEFLMVQVFRRGRIEQIIHKNAAITVRCETIAYDLNNVGSAMSNDAGQRKIDPDDGFFAHAIGSATETLSWGRT